MKFLEKASFQRSGILDAGIEVSLLKLNPRLMSSQQKIILITGCSSGFGLLFAARLASKGHIVIATMRNLEKKQPLLKEVEIRGGTIDLQCLDVTDTNSIRNVIQHIGQKYGSLDGLINNAGYGLAGFFEDLTDEEIRALMETNFFGAINVTRAALPLLHKSQKAKIINISSVSGFTTYPCFGAYNESKWALEAFSESLMYELKPFGIDVLLVQPGSYRTEIFYSNRKYAQNFDNPKSRYYSKSQCLKNLVDSNIKKNERNPEEVAILIEKLINQEKSKFRNIPDFSSKILFLLRKCLPFSLFAWIIQTSINNFYKNLGKK